MADNNQTGHRHLVEEEMRAAGDGVYGTKSAGGSPSNKMAAPADDKDAVSMSMTKAELMIAAEDAGVKLDGNETKADLIAKIEKVQG